MELISTDKKLLEIILLIFISKDVIFLMRSVLVNLADYIIETFGT